ncbi:MAG: hypothetical protein OHK93_001624 [Ramalina farinacea]|uniref:AA1-like domain-containing protein n=1 Tax=Ramalina farinacea TaxID=258253 RepID=A0AA43QSL7_9LECA|nr:hypothetical protein [Ramalina farinacea]
MYIPRLAYLTALALCASVSATPTPFGPHPVPAHLATQDPPPNYNLRFQPDGAFTNHSASLTLTTYTTPDCSAPSETSYQSNPLTWNIHMTGWKLFYSYTLSRNLTAAEQLDFWSLPSYGGGFQDGGCGPHMETASPDSKGAFLRGSEDEGVGRPCYKFAEGDPGTRPVLKDGTRPGGPAGYG